MRKITILGNSEGTLFVNIDTNKGVDIYGGGDEIYLVINSTSYEGEGGDGVFEISDGDFEYLYSKSQCINNTLRFHEEDPNYWVEFLIL